MSKMSSALALPASSSQVKDHQASALVPPTIRAVPYPSPGPLAQSFPEHFVLVSEEEQPGDWVRANVRKIRQGG